ncbi:MAG: PIN domain nuclease [Acidobacteriota bacterium]
MAYLEARYLVDKSALARMRKHAAVAERLAPILELGEAATCSMIDLEVLYSARTAEDHRQIRQRRDLAYRRFPMTEEIFQRAIAVQGLLAEQNLHRLPIPDLLVAATAERHDLTVLHYDRDCERIGAVTGQSMEWIVEPGSI